MRSNRPLIPSHKVTMTPEQLGVIGRRLYGRTWKRTLARALHVCEGTIIAWAGGQRPIPGPAIAALMAFLEIAGVRAPNLDADQP